MASRNERAEQLYLAVKAARAADRTSLLARYCADDPELKREVQDMLDKDDRLGSFMEHPPLGLLNKVMNEVPTITDDGAGEPRPPRPPEGRLANGLVLNKRFVIVRYIAKGGMGEVYEAEDQLLQDSHIALKTILPEIDSHRGFQLRFEHEVLAAREVVHPNLCPIYHIERCDEPPLGFLFLTMKLLPGETLAARLRRTGPLPKEEGLAVARQMADGLLAIHAARVVHRDIKSTNVMLDGSGNDVRLWITDFGLARALKADPSFSGKPTLAGTPGYIAPELYRGQPASRASDLYAFGVVLHEVFTGERPPEKGDGVPVTPGARLSAAGVPSPCADLIKGCLDDDPARRCAAFDEALEPLGLKRPQKRKWTRRQFAGMATAAACSFAAVGWLERDPLYNATHPLPARRFVALLPWPKTSDNNVAPMLTGVLTAIKGELSRLEAFDRNLFVISPEDVNQDLSKAAHLKDVCDPLGANLALAAAGGSNKNQFALTLRLIDPATSHSVREKRLTCALNETPSLPSRAVDAAASLLNLGRYLKTSERTESGTHSTQAYTAFQSAETLMKQPNYSGLAAGIEKYKEALDLDPHYVLAFAKLSEAYTRQYAIQRDPAALDLASANSERALDLDPQLVEGHLARAFVLQYSGDEQGALGELSRCLTLDPSNPGAMLWQAVIYARLNRWSDAEKAYRRVLKERPNSWITYTELGSLYHDQGRFQEAIQAFRDASAAAPASALPLSDLGVEYLQTGDFAAAAETLKKCLALAPDSDDVVVNVSLALRYQGKYEEALPYAMKAVQVNPKNDTNWLELGECYSSLRNKQSEARNAYSRAAKEAEQHLKTDQTDGPSWMLLALYRVKSGEPQSALSLIRKAESLGAADMDSQLYKARILNLLGKRDDSLATLKTCFEKGAGDLQMIPFPDMQDLRRDPRYQQMLRSQSKADRSGFLPTSSESSIHFGA
ncbi:MAG: protein kinase [Silvibacterium sp.]|nr:protein kinase [Silvibacterium sp.]